MLKSASFVLSDKFLITKVLIIMTLIGFIGWKSVDLYKTQKPNIEDLILNPEKYADKHVHLYLAKITKITKGGYEVEYLGITINVKDSAIPNLGDRAILNGTYIGNKIVIVEKSEFISHFPVKNAAIMIVSLGALFLFILQLKKRFLFKTPHFTGIK